MTSMTATAAEEQSQSHVAYVATALCDEHGWAGSDIAAVLPDFPLLSDPAQAKVLRSAGRIITDCPGPCPPEEVRAWLPLLWDTEPGSVTVWSPALMAWIANPGGKYRFSTPTGIVRMYVPRLGGDHALARQVFVSTIPLVQVRQMLADGVQRQALLALLALNLRLCTA